MAQYRLLVLNDELTFGFLDQLALPGLVFRLSGRASQTEILDQAAFR